MPTTAKKKASSVRHTRAIQRDRTKRPLSAPTDDQLTAQLTDTISTQVSVLRSIGRVRTAHHQALKPMENWYEIIQPATLQRVSYYHQLGLRERLLTLPVMVALVLSLIWRQVSGVSELVRLIRHETRLWVPPLQKLSQQALAQRLRTLAAEMFFRRLCNLLPVFHRRWQTRQRPVPAVIAWARTHDTRLRVCDGSTLDALTCKSGYCGTGPPIRSPAG